MAELTQAEFEAATERGRVATATEARAVSARYDRRRDRIIIELTNGSTFAFPPHLVQCLETMTADELSQVQVLGDGYDLHWDAQDTDFTVPGLVSGIFGTKAWLARRAGQTTSPAKAAAARRNGAKGGRPSKTA